MGILLVFLVEDPTTTKLYGKEQVMAQERARRGEELPGTPYGVIGYDPFASQAGVRLTIGDDFFRVSAGVRGVFSVESGAIIIDRRPSLDVGRPTSVGQPQITRSSIIPDFLRNAVQGSMIEGGELNVTSAIKKFAPGFPVFRLSEEDAILAEEGGVESVTRSNAGFRVVYADGITPLDWGSMVVLAFGVVMTLRALFA